MHRRTRQTPLPRVPDSYGAPACRYSGERTNAAKCKEDPDRRWQIVCPV
jgi:hypothetical protein